MMMMVMVARTDIKQAEWSMISTNQSTVSCWISTNESASLCKQGQAVAFFNGVRIHQVHADFNSDHDSDYVIKLRSVRS